MNKFLIFALFACVATAVANPIEINDEASQLALFETDDKEVSRLTEEKKMFGDYCLQARDEVKVFLKSSVNKGAAHVFNLLVDTVAQIAEAIAEAQKGAVEQGSKAVNEDARQIKDAVGGVFMALAGTGKEETLAKFESLKQLLTQENLKESAEQGCSLVNGTLKPSLEKKLTAYKNDLLKTPQGEQFKDLIKATRVENVGCVTTGRVSKISTGCRMMSLLGPTLMEFMGY